MSGNRTSIFEAFSMPHTSLLAPTVPHPNIIRCTAEEAANSVINIDENDYDYENSAFNDVEEIENCGDDNGTLWMSCSPGRDSGEENDSSGINAIYEPMNIMDFQPTEKYVPMEPLVVQDSSPLKLKFLVKESKSRDPINSDDNKPLSSYALFFRDTQIAIKDQNPDISFGEISRVVATMWDNLDANHKQYYNKLAEDAKVQDRSSKKEKLIQIHHHKDKPSAKKFSKDKYRSSEKLVKSSSTKRQPKSLSSKNLAEKGMTPTMNKCMREGCSNKAVDDPRWSKEYCSTLCVVSHCKDVYKAWVAIRKSSVNKKT